MHEDEQVYFRKQWLTKEHQLVSAYVDQYPHLGCYGTSRTESYHNPVKEWLNHHLGLEKAVKYLMQQIDTMVHKIMSEENQSRVGIPMVIDSEGFKSLSLKVTRYAISLIIPEWQQAKTIVLSSNMPHHLIASIVLTICVQMRNPQWLVVAPCQKRTSCPVAIRLIPRQLMHPRWWLDGPTWVPAEWESGVGLTSDELNPPPLDNSILHTKLINDGQLLLEKTAIEQESFRRQLGPEDV
jgi:hypothetical protein